LAKAKKKKRTLRKVLIWLILLALAAGCVYLFVLPKWKADATTTYSQYAARIGSISNSISFNGSVSVKNAETITADNAATVRVIYVEEEQQVKKDDRLMRLSDGTTVKASFDGQINLISPEVGDDVSMGETLVQVVDFGNMTVSMRVDEYSISELEVGQACRVTVTALSRTFDSIISHINRIPSGGGNTAYYTVTADLEVTDDVLPGMACTVTIPQEEAVDTVILNRDALSFGADNSAYVLMHDATGAFVEVPVEIGVDNDNYVQILSGVKEGDVVFKESKPVSNLNSMFAMFNSMNTQNTRQNNTNRQNSTQNNWNNSRNNSTRNFGGNMPVR